MSPARLAIFAIVSGLPSHERGSRQLLMIEAYCDGSTEDGKLLVVAGYVASVETWLAFSDAWKSELDRSNDGRPFKMVRAAKTAKGMRRAAAHYKLIEDFKLLGVGCAVPIKPLADAVAAAGVDRRIANPYYMAWRLMISTTLQTLDAGKIATPVEFVFDNQTESILIHKAWNLFYSNTPRKYRKRIKNNISFKDDDDVLPLQAADLLAWWARKQYLRDPLDMGAIFPKEWTAGPRLFFSHLTEAGIKKIIDAEVNRFTVRGRTVAREAFILEGVSYPGWPE